MTSLAGYTGMKGPSGLGNSIPDEYNIGRLQNYDDQQMDLYNRLHGNIGQDSYTARLARGDQAAFQEAEAPALRQFNELQGGLASRFSGQGLGGRHGSGFQLASNQQASNFAQDLASKRMSLQQQAIKDLHGMGNDLLNAKPYEQFLYQDQEEDNPWWGIGGAALGGGLGFLAGGPAGAMSGAKMGYQAGRGLGGGGSSNQGFRSSGNTDWASAASNFFG